MPAKIRRRFLKTSAVAAGTIVLISFSFVFSLAAVLEYAKFRESNGIIIKAPDKVAEEALDLAAAIVNEMVVDLRADILSRLIARDAAVAIIPKDEFITALPEFSHLSGQLDPNGNPYDSFAVRGAGAVIGQPVSATAEENLLGLPGDPFFAESITHHEFAHAIMNLGFDDSDHARWTQIFQNAVAMNKFPGTFAMTNRDEYWAELSQSFFSVNNEIGGPSEVAEEDGEAFSFLEEVYRQGPLDDPEAPPKVPMPWLLLLLEGE